MRGGGGAGRCGGSGGGCRDVPVRGGRGSQGGGCRCGGPARLCPGAPAGGAAGSRMRRPRGGGAGPRRREAVWPRRGGVMQMWPQGASSKSRAATAALGSVSQKAVEVAGWGGGSLGWGVPGKGRRCSGGGFLGRCSTAVGRAARAHHSCRVGSGWGLCRRHPSPPRAGLGAPLLFAQTHTAAAGRRSLPPAPDHPVADPADLPWLEILNL